MLVCTQVSCESSYRTDRWRSPHRWWATQLVLRGPAPEVLKSWVPTAPAGDTLEKSVKLGVLLQIKVSGVRVLM